MVYTRQSLAFAIETKGSLTYTTTRHLGLEHELDHHHTGAVDGVLLASGSCPTGFIKELTRVSLSPLIQDKSLVANFGSFGHCHSNDLSLSAHVHAG